MEELQPYFENYYTDIADRRNHADNYLVKCQELLATLDRDILLKLMLADLESGDILNIGGKRRYNILGNTDCPTPGEGGYFETIG